MTFPKVSICIPAYNQPGLLRKTLDSVFSQSFDDYEVIITDDSPNDSVKRIVSEFDSDKIRYHKNYEPKGSPENWNYAISLAKGQYIKPMHHDDWFTDRDCLMEFVKMLDDNPKADLVFSACLAVDMDGSLKFVHKPSNKQVEKLRTDPEILFYGNFIGSPSTTIFRQSIKECFDPKLKWVVDIDFYIKVLSKHRFEYNPKPLLSITTGTDRQVSAICNNKEVELYEFLYLSGQLKNTVIPDFRLVRFIGRLLAKYQVDTIGEINEFTSKPSKEIVIALYLSKFYCELKKIINFTFKKIKILKNTAKHILRLLSLKKAYASLRAFISRMSSSFKHSNALWSYSQCGEDLVVDYLFKNYLRIKFPTYLDIGANEPAIMNNTYLFYQEGSRGVCIEPNPELNEKIKKVRPNDISLNVGIGTSTFDKADFYVMSSNTLSSFSKEKTERLSGLAAQKTEKVLQIPLINVNEVIRKYFDSCPNFISIDTEGMDMEILQAIDFSTFRPEVFCIETLTYAENQSECKIQEITEFMKKNGYIVYADTYINTIYVNENIWEKR